MAFQLSQSIDPNRFRLLFQEHGFVHVPAILPPENASRVHKALLENTPWNLAFNDNQKHIEMPSDQINSLQKQDLNRLQQAIFNQAQNGFQYSYHNYPIYDAYKAGINDGHVLHDFYEWLNGEEFLTFARAVTGSEDISFVDAQATRYSPGHFLSTHDDSMEGKNRRAAYVFNFTQNWRVDWGGYLQLIDDAGNVRCGLAPTFNAINVLAIPQRHNVSFITPFAGGFRFSISGWFRCGSPD